MLSFDLNNLDRRIIYLLVFLALAWPLLAGYTVRPARMQSADKMYDLIKNLELAPGQIAFLSLDYGPNTKGENSPQSEVAIEHLMRRRIPFAVFSQYVLAEPFLKSVPERVAAKLMLEKPGEVWEYGKDWVNLGFRPGSGLIIQSIPKSENLAEYLNKDANGTPLSEIPVFKDIRTLKDIALLAEFTGLVGAFDNYVQFFQIKDYRPKFVHGCTSITIPEAYIYLDSGQLDGLLEGLAGAAWYSYLLSKDFPKRAKDKALLINTGLGIAHLVLIALILFGNLTMLIVALKNRMRTA